MSGVILAGLTYGPQLLMLIQGLVQAGVDGVSAFATISNIISEDRAPTDDEYAQAGLTADQVHVAIQGYSALAAS